LLEEGGVEFLSLPLLCNHSGESQSSVRAARGD
jgi:hypothetical protein